MDCLIRKKNVGRSLCVVNVSLLSQYLKVPADFEATEVQAADPDFWQSLLFNANPDDRGYLFPAAANMESASEETTYAQNPLKDVKVRDGKYMFRFLHDVDLCTHQNMRSHSGNGGRVIFFDIENNCIGTENSAGNFTGLNISLFNVEKMRLNDGTNPTYTPVYIVLKDNKDLDERGWIVDGAFVNDLTPVTDVELTITQQTTALIKVSVKGKCDGVAISGLANIANFILKTTAGAAQTILSVTEDAVVSGLYTLNKDAVNFADGSLDLAAPAVLTVKGYEADAIVVDIP